MKLSQADYTAPPSPQAARLQNTQPLAHDPRRRPAQLANEHRQPPSRPIIQPRLYRCPHTHIVLHLITCITGMTVPRRLSTIFDGAERHRTSQYCFPVDSWPRLISNLRSCRPWDYLMRCREAKAASRACCGLPFRAVVTSTTLEPKGTGYARSSAFFP